MKYMCPVCGYHDLSKPAYVSDIGSYEICHCCGFQYEVSDLDDGYTHEEWRKEWIENGMIWNEGRTKPPLDWDPRKQLLNVMLADEIPK